MKLDALVIGDLHINQTRRSAICVAMDSIFASISGMEFKIIVILGDIFDKTPTVEERVIFSEFIALLMPHTDRIVLIKGTDSHEYTKGVYNLEDLLKITNLEAVEEFEIGNFVFGHYEMSGTKYANGYTSDSKRVIDPNKTYLLGHIHQPKCSFDNVNYVGSIYKTDFSEIADEKRIAIIKEGGLVWLPLKSQGMVELCLVGNDKVTVVKKQGKGGETIDLKLKASTTRQCLPEIHRIIEKVKAENNIEYYQQEITLLDVKVEIPKNLNRDELMKKYCEEKGIPLEIVKKYWKVK